MKFKMKPGQTIKDHIVKVVSYLDEVDINRAQIDKKRLRWI